MESLSSTKCIHSLTSEYEARVNRIIVFLMPLGEDKDRYKKGFQRQNAANVYQYKMNYHGGSTDLSYYENKETVIYHKYVIMNNFQHPELKLILQHTLLLYMHGALAKTDSIIYRCSALT